MTDTKTSLDKSKDVCAFSRSVSVPASASASLEDGVMENDVSEPKRTLRRSRSGRLRPMTRTRSLVSTYDFGVGEQGGLDFGSGPVRIGGEWSDLDMKTRIERGWSGLQKEDLKTRIERGWTGLQKEDLKTRIERGWTGLQKEDLKKVAADN